MSEQSSGPSAADMEALARYAQALADGIEASLGRWVERSVVVVCENAGVMMTGNLRQQAREAGVQATAEIAPQVRSLLLLDIDEQRTGPLELVRRAVSWPTEVLQLAAVPEVVRDESARMMFPNDLYDLTPGSFRDIDSSLHEPGLEWGAAKAHVHLARRRAASQR